MQDDYRRNRKRGNPVREWFSDNLRYIILILLLAAIVVGVFFVVRIMRQRAAEDRSGTAISQESTTQSTSAGSSGAETTVAPTASVTPAPTATPTPTPTPEPTPAADEHFLSETDSDASQTVQNYFRELQGSAENTAVESYSRFSVYTTPGLQDGEVVALASYLVKYNGYAAEVPSLTDFYLVKDGNGQYVPVDELTPEQEAYCNEVVLGADAQTLIKNVRAEMETVLENNPELKSFIEGLG